MSLTAGTRLGPYEIVAPLGAGGMGEVYRARDTALGRDVALKTLPEGLSADPDRLMRFEREARTLASLNHPNIATIYGVERTADATALVMELVEGRDLSEVIGASAVGATGLQTGLPLDEALPIARQIAEALEAAHEAGIIHRDLKPANIKVRADGTVKVLDFGLAKALAPGAEAPGLRSDGGAGLQARADSPTMTSPALTAMGIILGTAAYMSPEQARGRPVDRRSDIWAFGVVLFEMLTGRRLFDGPTISDTIAAVLRADLDPTLLPPDTPPAVRRLVARCLDRDPKTRLRDIGEARVVLQTTAPDDVAEASAPPHAPSRWSPVSLTVAAVTAMVGAVGWWLWAGSAAAVTPAATVRAEIATPEVAPSSVQSSIAFTSDGRTLLLVGSNGTERRLFRRILDEATYVPIAGTEGARTVFLSPDDMWVGFSTGDAMKKVRLEGGTPETIRHWTGTGAEDVVPVGWSAANGPIGAAWLLDHTIVYGRFAGGLWRVSENGGNPTRFTTLDDTTVEFAHRLPHLSPDGRYLTFTIQRGVMSGIRTIEVLELATGRRAVLEEDGTDGRLTATGHLVFARDGALFAVRFDEANLRGVGEPVRVVPDVRHFVGGGAPGNATGAVDAAVSSSGTLVFRGGGVNGGGQSQLAWLSRGGGVDTIGPPMPRLLTAALSPDGREALFGAAARSQRFDLERQLGTPLGPGGPFRLWLADQTGLVKGGGRQLVRVAFDRPDEEHTVATSAHQVWPSQMSADGQWLFFVETHPTTGNDIWVTGLEPDSVARPVLQTPDDEGYPVLSPDGRWLAYSVRTGDTAVAYIQSFPEPGGRVRVSSVNGSRLGWTPKGDGLLTAGEGQVFITAIDGSGPKVVVGRTEVFSTQATAGTTPVGALYVHPTTGRLLAVLPAGNAQARPISTSAQLIVNAAALLDGGRQ